MEALQIEVEETYSRRNIRGIVRDEIEKNSSIIQDMFLRINKYRYGEYTYQSKVNRTVSLKPTSLEIAVDLATLILPIKEVSPIQATVGLLAPQLGYTNILDGIKTAAEIIAVCEPSGLYDIYHTTANDNEIGTLAIKAKYEVSSKTRTFIDKTKYLPPMLCKPINWTSRTKGGYLNGCGSMLLKHINQNHEEQRLDVLNILQEIPWELNEDMLEFEEVSKKELDTYEKRVNFKRISDSSEEVYKDLLEQGNEFYFVWKRDSRGRSYSQGYHVNLQGNEYRKSTINFANKTLLTDEVII